MLILQRHVGERIRVRFQPEYGAPVDVWIEVSSCIPGRTRLGFSAPQSVLLSREELLATGERFEVVKVAR